MKSVYAGRVGDTHTAWLKVLKGETRGLARDQRLRAGECVKYVYASGGDHENRPAVNSVSGDDRQQCGRGQAWSLKSMPAGKGEGPRGRLGACAPSSFGALVASLWPQVSLEDRTVRKEE